MSSRVQLANGLHLLRHPKGDLWAADEYCGCYDWADALINVGACTVDPEERDASLDRCAVCGLTLQQHRRSKTAPHLPPPAQLFCNGYKEAIK